MENQFLPEVSDFNLQKMTKVEIYVIMPKDKTLEVEMKALIVKNNEEKLWKKILKNNSIFLIGIILLVYKGLLLNYLLNLQIGIEVVLYTIVVAMLIMCPVINNRNKFSYIYLNIAYTIITIIIYANFLYYSYSTNFLSFYQIGNIKYAKEIGYGLSYIINIKNMLIFWVDNILVLIVSILSYKKFEHSYYKNKILKTVLIITILLLNIILVKTKIDNIYVDKVYNKSLIVEGISIYYYHYEDAKDYIYNLFGAEDVDEEKIQEIYDELLNQKTDSTEYTGIAEDCNVIIVQLESMSEYVIGKTVNGKEITPNLNKFFSENIYCSDMYNQGLGTTADSEFEMENSMYPLENGYVFQRYYGNTWKDIYSTLKENGYYTSFMHPNTSTFWNREEVYNTGYNIDEYYDIDSFSNIESAGEFYSDEGFFEEAVNIMSSYEGNFCTTLVSVTTHIPFYLTGVSNLEEKITITEEDVKYFEDETFRNYLISCNFVDYAFGKFIEKLEESGLLENSIIIVYGDHGPGLSSTDDIERLYEENGLNYTELDDITKDIRVPFGMKVPSIDESILIDRTVSKIDIKPTILDLLGVEDEFSIGNTIFSTKDYSFIKGLGFVTSKNYYINGKYYSRETFEEIDETQELQNLLRQMENEIYLSDTIIKNDLLSCFNDN